MIRQVIGLGQGRIQPLASLFRQLHISKPELGEALVPIRGSYIAQKITLMKVRSDEEIKRVLSPPDNNYADATCNSRVPLLTQARQGILEIPLSSFIKPSIGIPPEMLRRLEYKTPIIQRDIIPIEIPTSQTNIKKNIQDAPFNPSRIEKHAARLIVIRRSKMNKHKLRKLRKKMKYTWAKIRLRRAIKREKAYLNEKVELITAARNFDAKEYVTNVIKRAKEEPIPRKWTDPLMPEWFKEQEMQKEKQQERYQKMINLYLNKGIIIDYTPKKK